MSTFGQINLLVSDMAAAIEFYRWNKIGDLLGTSAQAAQQRYATVVEQT